MIQCVKDAVRRCLPKSLYFKLWLMRYAKRDRLLQRHLEVVRYLKRQATSDPEKDEILSFLAENAIRTFPYAFTLRMKPEEVEVAGTGARPYVLYEGKQLYFKERWNEEDIRDYHYNLLIEQQAGSPHCYFDKPAYLPEVGDVAADLGAAEGIWALSVVERCERLYLFEPDEEWMEPLGRTFHPWRDRVVIENQAVGACGSEGTSSLDAYFEDRRIDCLKADIEGAEGAMFRGGATTFSRKIAKALVCCYHHYDDEAYIRRALARSGFDRIETTGGYVFFGVGEERPIYPPYLSRGIVLGRKADAWGRDHE